MEWDGFHDINGMGLNGMDFINFCLLFYVFSQKYIVNNQFFKMVSDVNGMYGGASGAAKAGSYKILILSVK